MRTATGSASKSRSFLTEDDYENLRWYLEEFMDLPDGGAATAAEWAQKRAALGEELERRAGGGGVLPAQMLKALQALALACAQAGFGDGNLGPAEEEALAQVEQLPVPFPSFAGCLRQIAAGQLPPIPSDLPTELKQLLEPVAQAIRQAQRG